jgi:hypothetical protein
VYFYIFNFRLFISAIIFTKIILIILVYFILNLYLDIKPSNNQFIEYMKESKSRHMLNSYKFHDYEKIFIGTSKTLYHVSTDVFKKKKLNIYNYGVSGVNFYDYPYMVKKSILLNPKEIIISFPLSFLYEENISSNTFRGILFEDFKYIVKTHSLKLSAIAFTEMLKNLYLPFLYAQNINSKIGSIYRIFNIRITSNEFKKTTKDSIKNTKLGDYRPHIDCDPFWDKGPIINCTNGDGILFGNLEKMPNYKELVFLNNKDLNTYKVDLLNLLDETLEEKNIKLILIFEPTKNIYQFDDKFLSKKLNSKVLNENIFEIKNIYLRDSSHFNSTGRKFYSEFLLNELSIN